MHERMTREVGQERWTGLDRQLAERARDAQVDLRVVPADCDGRFRAVRDGDSVRGVYRRSVMLASGRFAMLDDGIGLSLVPWKPVLEQRLGRTVSGVVHGGSVS